MTDRLSPPIITFFALYRFVPKIDAFSYKTVENQCFCPKQNKSDPKFDSNRWKIHCQKISNLPRGLFDMSGCQRGSPIILSWPLFYDSDDNINKVEVFEIRNLKNKLKVRRQIPLCANFEKSTIIKIRTIKIRAKQ